MSPDNAQLLQRIQRMHSKARAYLDSDPEVALMLARKATEALAKGLLTFRAIEVPKERTLQTLLETIAHAKLAPRSVLIQFRTIQDHGNFGSHDQGTENDAINSAYVLPCIAALNYLTSWFTDLIWPPIRFAELPTLLELSEALELKPFKLISDLIELNVFAKSDTQLTRELIEFLLRKRGDMRRIEIGVKPDPQR